MQCRHALDVRLVNDRFSPRSCGTAIAVPIVSRIDDDAFGHRRGAIGSARTIRGPCAAADSITEHRVVPRGFTIDHAGVGIEQQLGRIEAMPRGGIVSAAYAIAVTLAGSKAGNVGVPDEL